LYTKQKNISTHSSQAEAGTGKMDEDLSEFKNLVNLMQATPKAPVPDHFTQNVMGRIREIKPSILSRALNVLLQSREVDCNLSRVMAGKAKSPTEFASMFFIVGFFYLIIGAFLIIGFKGFMTEAAINQWIRMQPQIIIATALWLIIQGAALLLDGKIAVKAAELGTLFFIGFSVMNGVIMVSNTPLSIVFILAFAGTGLMMSAFLGFAILSYQKHHNQRKGYSG
jgi:hypothetical protein